MFKDLFIKIIKLDKNWHADVFQSVFIERRIVL